MFAAVSFTRYEEAGRACASRLIAWRSRAPMFRILTQGSVPDSRVLLVIDGEGTHHDAQGIGIGASRIGFDGGQVPMRPASKLSTSDTWRAPVAIRYEA